MSVLPNTVRHYDHRSITEKNRQAAGRAFCHFPTFLDDLKTSGCVRINLARLIPGKIRQYTRKRLILR
jgi:hypothetical protein